MTSVVSNVKTLHTPVKCLLWSVSVWDSLELYKCLSVREAGSSQLMMMETG